VALNLGQYERNALENRQFVAEPPPRRGSNPARIAVIEMVHPRRTEIFAPPAARPATLSAPPHQKIPARLLTVRAQLEFTLTRSLAVTFWDGYVVSPILVQDLHQCLAATAFAFGGLDRVAGRLDWLAIDLENHVVFTQTSFIR
jgi:hypothetical protein